MSAPQLSAQRSFSTSSSVPRGDRRGAHVGVDLGLRQRGRCHRVELVAEVHLVGRDDHATGGDFVADLLRREVRLAHRYARSSPA